MTQSFETESDKDETISIKMDEENIKKDTGEEFTRQIETLQKRNTDKDTHIKKIESENNVLRTDMSDMQEKLNNLISIQDNLLNTDSKKSNQETALDEDKLMEKLLNKIEGNKAKEVQNNNFKEVSDRLTSLYGKDEVDSKVSKLAKESGMSFSDVLELAKKSPKIVYKVLGIEDKIQTSKTTHGTNVGFKQTSNSKEERLTYFSKLRKEKPEEYWKPETQKEFRNLFL